MMREEKVTRHIIKWLESSGWEIICYDFPQSGTGIMLHPDKGDAAAEKNKGGIIPDIVAVKGNIAVFVENKDKFVFSDFEKILFLKTSNLYARSLSNLLTGRGISVICYGIGMPMEPKSLQKAMLHTEKIDFLILVEDGGAVNIGFVSDSIELEFN
ncbi:MAG: hypothetical protein Q4G28_07005 [Neisseria sp.]|nr:hypothetical protein [Neisseria sp.]